MVWFVVAFECGENCELKQKAGSESFVTDVFPAAWVPSHPRRW